MAHHTLLHAADSGRFDEVKSLIEGMNFILKNFFSIL
jgi:hypothetical protein